MTTRREALLSGLFGAGYVGLRALATGLPAWFVANPRSASAADLACALAPGRAQFLIASASSAGDAISCNCPGTYEVPAIIHPTQAEFAPTTFSLGDRSVIGAQVWSTLSEPVRARTHFFHHVTGGIVHGDHPKVMRLLGNTAGNEMWPSLYAKHLHRCLGTVQAEPVAVGTGGNALELLSFQGRTLATVSPTQLKQLLTGSQTDPVVKLRKLRDRTLDELHAIAKQSGTPEQRTFLDAVARSQTQVRQLSESLATTLEAIVDDTVRGQALAAAALVAAKVSPAVTLHIPFGKDNHDDPGLYDEWFDHTDHGGVGAGVPGIQMVMDALSALKLEQSATFATMNVFGRDLNGTAKVDARNGRDHFGNHAVMLMIGRNVAPGVSGGVTPINGAVYGASDIDSQSGASVASDGDIPRADTQVAAAKTLGLALGIPAELLDADFTAENAGVRAVGSALRVG